MIGLLLLLIEVGDLHGLWGLPGRSDISIPLQKSHTKRTRMRGFSPTDSMQSAAPEQARSAVGDVLALREGRKIVPLVEAE